MFRSMLVRIALVAVFLPAIPVTLAAIKSNIRAFTPNTFNKFSSRPGPRLLVFDDQALLPEDATPEDMEAARKVITDLCNDPKNEVHIVATDGLENLQELYGDISGIHLAIVDDRKQEIEELAKKHGLEPEYSREYHQFLFRFTSHDEANVARRMIEDMAKDYDVPCGYGPDSENTMFFTLNMPNKGHYVKNLLKNRAYQAGITFGARALEGMDKAIEERGNAFRSVFVGRAILAGNASHWVLDSNKLFEAFQQLQTSSIWGSLSKLLLGITG